MGMAQLASTALSDPLNAWYLVQQRACPRRLIDRLQQLGQAAGIKPAFILSFDCDTDADIVLSRAVHDRLGKLGITPVYAVPGELLERGAETWHAIAATGAEFINHGFRTHTVLRHGNYVSNLFYDQMSPADIEQDIERGHASILSVIGRAPEGFRAPHFGTFSGDAQLRSLHGILTKLGYRFSTSSTPYLALRHGPLIGRYGLAELPVSGCVDYPLVILDSYTFRFAQNRLNAEDYLAQSAAWADRLAAGQPFFVNLYADPSQVADWPEFFEAMQRLAPFAKSSYAAYLDEIAS